MKNIYRQLKRLEHKNRSIEKPKPEVNTSIRISLAALLISFVSSLILGCTLYFQFFYKSHTIRLTVNDIDVCNDSIISSRILFTNLGNQYVSINDCRFFYCYDNDLDDYLRAPLYKKATNPFTLPPGQQSFYEVEHSLILGEDYWLLRGNYDFMGYNDESFVSPISHDTIVRHKFTLCLEVEYFNEKGILSYHYEKMGVINFRRKNYERKAKPENIGYIPKMFLLREMNSVENTSFAVLVN